MTEIETPNDRASAREEGSALVLTLILTLLLATVILSLAASVEMQSRASMRKNVRNRQVSAADTAMAKAIVLAQQNYTTYEAYSSLTQVIPSSGTYGDGTSWEDDGEAAIENIGGTTSFPYTFRIRSRGQVTGTDGERELEMIIRISQEFTPLNVPGLGAVVGNGDITVNGNIEIDGNDYNPDGTDRTDAGAMDVSGVTVTGGLSHSGSATIGGNGTSPEDSSDATDNDNYDTTTSIWNQEDNLSGDIKSDGFDNDGDGTPDDATEDVDTFNNDGIDNDNDGMIDGADTDGELDNGTDDSFDYGNWENDGHDNDGDGITDEDGFPPMAAHLLNKTSETTDEIFIEKARDNGTFFRYDATGNSAKLRAWQTGDGDGPYHTGQLYSDWLSSDDAKDGGDIVYVQGRPESEISGSHTDFGGFTLPDNGDVTYNPDYKPTLFIIQGHKYGDHDFDGDYSDNGHGSHDHHKDDNEGVIVGPIKVKNRAGPNDGTFLGIFITDTVNDTNGNGQIIGSVYAFNADDSTIFGNGNFKILFSSEVIGGIEDPSDESRPLAPPTVLLWREVE